MWTHTCQRAPPSLNVSHRFRFWGQWAGSGTHALANLLINSVYNLRPSKDVTINNRLNKYSGSFFLPMNSSWRWFCCSLVRLAVVAHEPAPLHLLQTSGSPISPQLLRAGEEPLTAAVHDTALRPTMGKQFVDINNRKVASWWQKHQTKI